MSRALWAGQIALSVIFAGLPLYIWREEPVFGIVISVVIGGVLAKQIRNDIADRQQR